MEFIREYWPIIVSVIVVAFDWGIIYQKIKCLEVQKVTKDEVQKMVKSEVKGQLANHCPFSDNVDTLQQEVAKLTVWREEHTEWGASENEKNHLKLQEISINVQRLCEKQGVKYFKNGSK